MEQEKNQGQSSEVVNNMQPESIHDGVNIEHVYDGTVEEDLSGCAGRIDGIHVYDILAPFMGKEVELVIRHLTEPPAVQTDSLAEAENQTNKSGISAQSYDGTSGTDREAEGPWEVRTMGLIWRRNDELGITCGTIDVTDPRTLIDPQELCDLLNGVHRTKEVLRELHEAANRYAEVAPNVCDQKTLNLAYEAHDALTAKLAAAQAELSKGE